MNSYPPSILALALAILLCLPGCAAKPASPASATSRDLDDDRVLVTLHAREPLGVTALSPSGHLGYRPPDSQGSRKAQLETARQLAAEFKLQLEEDWEIPSLGVHCFVFRLSDAKRQQRVMAQLGEHPRVESVQALQFFHGEAATPSSAPSGDAPGGDPLGKWDITLNEKLRAAHRSATGRSVSVAVIDTGLDAAHEDLVGADMRTVDFVDGRDTVPAEMHGTAVVGLLAARPDNGIGIRGFAPDARVLLIRACWEPQEGKETAVCNSFTLAKALSLALQVGVDIVNLSISGPRDPLLERLAGELVRRGQWVIAAGAGTDTFPGSVSRSVLAARYAGATGSAEPAFTLLPGNRYGLRNGTSITTARIAGAAALMKQLMPEMHAAELENLLSSSIGPSGTASSPLLDVARLLAPSAPETAVQD